MCAPVLRCLRSCRLLRSWGIIAWLDIIYTCRRRASATHFCLSVVPSLGRSATEMLLHVEYSKQHRKVYLRQGHRSNACMVSSLQEGCLYLLLNKHIG